MIRRLLAAVIIAVAAFVLGRVTAEAAVAIDEALPLPAGARVDQTRGALPMGEDGSTALVYEVNYSQWRVRIEATDGSVRDLALPLPATSAVAASDQFNFVRWQWDGHWLYVLGGDRRWVGDGYTDFRAYVRLWTIQIAGDAVFMDSAEEFTYGIHQDLLLLPSGGLVALVNLRHCAVYSPCAGFPSEQGLGEMHPTLFYRTPTGEWQGPIDLTQTVGYAKFTGLLVRRGDDGSIWAFVKPDGADALDAFRLVESDTHTLVVMQRLPSYIAAHWEFDGATQTSFLAGDGLNAPHGEQPWLAGYYDDGERAIMLAYQSQAGALGGVAYGAHIAVAHIAANGSRLFLPRFELDWTERTGQFAFLRDGAGVFWLAYPSNPGQFVSTVSPEPLRAAAFDGSRWTVQGTLGTTYIKLPGIAYSQDAPRFLATMNDLRVHDMTLGAVNSVPATTVVAATVAPTRTPTPTPTIAPRTPTPISTLTHCPPGWRKQRLC